MAKGQSKNATIAAPLFTPAQVFDSAAALLAQSADERVAERAALLPLDQSAVSSGIMAALAAPATEPTRREENETKRIPAVSAETLRGADGLAIGLAIRFADGTGFDVAMGDYSEAILSEATWHGFKQKYVDSAAISRNPDTGRSATIADKKAAVLAIREQIEGADGRWNRGREGAAHTAGTLVYRALCRLYPNRTPEQVRAWFDAKTDDERKRMTGNPRVIRAIADIRAEQAAASAAPDVNPFAGLDD